MRGDSTSRYKRAVYRKTKKWIKKMQGQCLCRSTPFKVYLQNHHCIFCGDHLLLDVTSGCYNLVLVPSGLTLLRPSCVCLKSTAGRFKAGGGIYSDHPPEGYRFVKNTQKLVEADDGTLFAKNEGKIIPTVLCAEFTHWYF